MTNIKKIHQAFDMHAQAYQDKYMQLNNYNDSYDIFCKNISAGNAKILDVGCGPGNISNYLLSKRPDFKVNGIDISENMIALASANNPQALFSVGDCRDLKNLENNYDGIISGFLLPYFNKKETLTFINQTTNLLKENGLLFISTMESESSPNKGSAGSVALKTNYHQGIWLQKQLIKNGYKIIHLKRQEFLHTNGTKYTDLILIAQK